MPTAIFVWNFGRIQDFNLGEKLGKVSGSFIDFLIWNFTLKSGRRWKSVPSKSHKMSLLSLKWAKAVVSKLRPETWNSSSIICPLLCYFPFLLKLPTSWNMVISLKICCQIGFCLFSNIATFIGECKYFCTTSYLQRNFGFGRKEFL